MNFKKVISTFLISIFLSSFLTVTNVLAYNIDDCYDDFSDELLSEEEIEAYSFANLPQKVDLSESPCFPPIGNQGNHGSCVAWATTYYQYSYEVNKLNNVTNIADREVYSPYFVYNLTNDGYDKGTKIKRVYDTLANLGCLKLEDFDYESYRVWPNVNDDMRMKLIEALNTRLESHNKEVIPNNCNISNPSNLTSRNIPLSNVKSLLNDGKVLVVPTKGFFNSDIVNNECVAYRCYKGSESGHELTIVGYDNNISYDVNGNGTIESCERGAFKVANSWGENFNQNGIFSNNGYFWVMYDALNLKSTNDYNDWEKSYDTTRYPAFSTSKTETENNEFYYINVENKKVNLIGEVKIETDRKYGLSINYKVTGNGISIKLGTPLEPYQPENGANTSPFNSSIIFDYGNYIDNIYNYWDNYKYSVTISKESGTNLNKAQLRLLDNHGNVVLDYDSNLISQNRTLQLKAGDVDYDGVLTESDATFIMNIISKNNNPSNLQRNLADYDRNGLVNINDVIKIRQNIASNSNANLSELDDMIISYLNTSEDNIDISDCEEYLLNNIMNGDVVYEN